MAKLIDPDRLIAELHERRLSTGKFVQWEAAIGKAMVEVPEIVRCVDCKHCFSLTEDPLQPYDGEFEWYCEINDRDYNVHARDPRRYYCANGERREAPGDGE